MTPTSIVSAALPRPPDYSAEFTARVQALARLLEPALSMPLKHDTNMNYRAGQHLSCRLKLRGKGAVEIRFYISSKGPLFAIYMLDRGGTLTQLGQLGHPIAENLLPDEIAAPLDGARKILSDQGYTEVPSRLFDTPAPGCTTELDDLPATVFQCLFAEII